MSLCSFFHSFTLLHRLIMMRMFHVVAHVAYVMLFDSIMFLAGPSGGCSCIRGSTPLISSSYKGCMALAYFCGVIREKDSGRDLPSYLQSKLLPHLHTSIPFHTSKPYLHSPVYSIYTSSLHPHLNSCTRAKLLLSRLCTTIRPFPATNSTGSIVFPPAARP